MKKQYYILSLNHNNPEMLVWWRENNNGYTTILNQAGKYDEDFIKQNQSYYNNNRETVAILCHTVDEFAVKCVPSDINVFEKLGVKIN